MKRRFSVQCMTDWCEFLALDVTKMNEIAEHFEGSFNDFFTDANKINYYLTKQKDKALKENINDYSVN